jgi:hypothetical protein
MFFLFVFCLFPTGTTETLPNLDSERLEEAEGGESVCITVLKRAVLTEQHSVNQSFAAIFTGLLQAGSPSTSCASHANTGREREAMWWGVLS